MPGGVSNLDDTESITAFLHLFGKPVLSDLAGDFIRLRADVLQPYFSARYREAPRSGEGIGNEGTRQSQATQPISPRVNGLLPFVIFFQVPHASQS